MKSARLLPWFGSNTENAASAGAMLRGCRWVGIPFAGGMSEVPYIDCKQILANDLHRHVVNLCRVIADNRERRWLVEQADALPYHPDILAMYQRDAVNEPDYSISSAPDGYAALCYFVSVWMGRGGKAGTTGEFDGSLPIRWNANGGGSNRRYRTAIEALDAWGETFRRCEFVCMDAFEFLDKCRDSRETGIFVDAPWPDAGEEYRHQFSDGDQTRLAERLMKFTQARVVVRFGEHPLIRSLYPESSGWTWHPLTSRNQANDVKPEFLIVRNGAA
jgi:site-specific DNA-adenine methylase